MKVRIKSMEQILNIPHMTVTRNAVYYPKWGRWTMTNAIIGKTVDIVVFTGSQHELIPYIVPSTGDFVYDKCIDEWIER